MRNLCLSSDLFATHVTHAEPRKDPLLHQEPGNASKPGTTAHSTQSGNSAATPCFGFATVSTSYARAPPAPGPVDGRGSQDLPCSARLHRRRLRGSESVNVEGSLHCGRPRANCWVAFISFMYFTRSYSSYPTGADEDEFQLHLVIKERPGDPTAALTTQRALVKLKELSDRQDVQPETDYG